MILIGFNLKFLLFDVECSRMKSSRKWTVVLMRKFNVTGTCVPTKHYMVDMTDKLKQIKAMTDEGEYFTINRGRQYGKTTTLTGLETYLADEYLVISISFEGFSESNFANEKAFCQEFLIAIDESLEFLESAPCWRDETIENLGQLGRHIKKMCRDKKVVLMIDEVDKASNYNVFLDFLNTLRKKFLARAKGRDFTFHSVILAGVYDVRNIKLKMTNDGLYTPEKGERKINSPWNIAVTFEIDMSFSPTEIAGMLKDYEQDQKTGMDVEQISREIHKYTDGYPFLVSRICQIIHDKLEKNWTKEGVQEAVKLILIEKNMLFDDLIKNLENNQELSDFVYKLLIDGQSFLFNTDNKLIDLGVRYGYFKAVKRNVKISNKIFEIRISEYFISNDEIAGKRRHLNVIQQDVVQNDRFNMQLCLEKFALHYAEIYADKDAAFFERHGRLIFMTYLRPLINGKGFYHIESQTTDERKMDLVVDFGEDQFIVELKIWRGEVKRQENYAQLAGYLEKKNAKRGYLLTFDFRTRAKEQRVEWIRIKDKEIYEVQV